MDEHLEKRYRQVGNLSQRALWPLAGAVDVDRKKLRLVSFHLDPPRNREVSATGLASDGTLHLSHVRDAQTLMAPAGLRRC